MTFTPIISTAYLGAQENQGGKRLHMNKTGIIDYTYPYGMYNLCWYQLELKYQKEEKAVWLCQTNTGLVLSLAPLQLLGFIVCF